MCFSRRLDNEVALALTVNLGDQVKMDFPVDRALLDPLDKMGKVNTSFSLLENEIFILIFFRRTSRWPRNEWKEWNPWWARTGR